MCHVLYFQIITCLATFFMCNVLCVMCNEDYVYIAPKRAIYTRARVYSKQIG